MSGIIARLRSRVSSFSQGLAGMAGIGALALSVALAGCGGKEPAPARTPVAQAPGKAQTPARPSKPARPDIAQPGTPAPDAVTFKIGLLLPLTGGSSELGAAMLDAAVLSLSDSYEGMSESEGRKIQVILLPRDASQPQMASAAANDLLREKVDLLIGPLFSPAVMEVAPLARARNVPVLALSNNRQVAQPGVFLMGFQPEEQISRVVEYASEHGVKTLAALGPADAYGQVALRLLNEEARKGAVTLTAVEMYPPGEGAPAYEINRLTSGEPFEGLFLPEAGPKLDMILAVLPDSGLDMTRIRLLGTGLWDDPSMLRKSGLEGAWLASSPPERFTRFSRRFRATYGYAPPRLSSLAYDATALAVTLAKQSGKAGFNAQALSDPRGFEGPANGIFRFLPDGTSQRGLSVLEITGSGFKEVGPAPHSF